MIVGEGTNEIQRNVIARQLVDRRHNADLPADGTASQRCRHRGSPVHEECSSCVADLGNRTHRLVMATHDRWGSKGWNAATGSFNRPPSISLDEIWVRNHPVTSFTRPFAIPSVEPTCNLAHR